MSGFSNLLDISSFFIGVLVNLLLVAMICFYFKRKIDNLELSQSEQAKILFQLLQNKPSQGNTESNVGSETYHVLNNLDLSQLGDENDDVQGESYDGDADAVNGSDLDNESDDDESDSDDDESDDEQTTKTIDYEDKSKDDLDMEMIEKKTIKELRALLENRGIHISKKNVKKQELIEMFKPSVQVVEEVIKIEEETSKSEDQPVEEVEQVEQVEDVEPVEEVSLAPVEVKEVSLEVQEVNNDSSEINNDSGELL